MKQISELSASKITLHGLLRFIQVWVWLQSWPEQVPWGFDTNTWGLKINRHALDGLVLDLVCHPCLLKLHLCYIEVVPITVTLLSCRQQVQGMRFDNDEVFPSCNLGWCNCWYSKTTWLFHNHQTFHSGMFFWNCVICFLFVAIIVPCSTYVGDKAAMHYVRC